MRDILSALKDFARQMKEAFIAIRDLFLEIINAIRSMFSWLLSIVNICSNKYGSPYERCNKAFDDAIEDCWKKLGIFGFMCYIVSAIKYVCEVARIVDLLCAIPKAIKTGIIEPIKQRILYAICVVLAVTESYGLRMRHVICGCYLPARERTRAVWLYNKILKTRGGITKFLRRRIRQKVQGDDTLEEISLMDRLTNQFPLFGRIARAFGYAKIHCLCCNESGDSEDYTTFKRCSTPGCKGLYCYSCFREIKNICTLCMNPVDYGDLSDISEERDSSEQEASLQDSVGVMTDVGDSDSEASSGGPDRAYQYGKGTRSNHVEDGKQSFKDLEAKAVKKDLATLEDLTESEAESVNQEYDEKLI